MEYGCNVLSCETVFSRSNKIPLVSPHCFMLPSRQMQISCFSSVETSEKSTLQRPENQLLSTWIHICCCIASFLRLLISLSRWKKPKINVVQGICIPLERSHNGIINPHFLGYVWAVNNAAHFSNLICHFVDAPLTVLRYHVGMCTRGASLKSYQIFLDKPSWHLSPITHHTINYCRVKVRRVERAAITQTDTHRIIYPAHKSGPCSRALPAPLVPADLSDVSL